MSFGAAWPMLALISVIAGCGVVRMPAARSGPASPASASPAPTARPGAGGPRLTSVPDSGLVGGEQLTVRLSGFPERATVMVYECAGAPPAGAAAGCGGAAAQYLYTGTTGSASGVFVAQPAAANAGATSATSPCRRRCVLVARVIKQGAGVPASPAPMATAALSFSSTAVAGLADASLVDLTWISPTDGWALAGQPCMGGTCARLARTTDGGAHWQALANTSAQLMDGTEDCTKVACVSGLRFASPEVGYLFGPALLMTRDGGRSWARQPGPQVETLTVVGGVVYRVVYDHGGCPGPCAPMLQMSRIGGSVWQTLIGQINTPDRSDSAQVVHSGSTLLVAMYGSQAGPASAQAIVYRSSNGGTSWTQLPDPCSGRGPGGAAEEVDLVDLAGAPGGFFAGLCTPRQGSHAFVITSADAGRTWHTSGALPKLSALARLAAASPTHLAVSTGPVAGGGAFTATLLVTSDGGGHWVVAATDDQQLTQSGVPAWLGFENAAVGRWISAPHTIWNTADAGLHWTRTSFR